MTTHHGTARHRTPTTLSRLSVPHWSWMAALLWALRLVTAAGLAIDAYVHAHLAPGYDPVAATISQGDLFRIEAGFSAAAALLVLVAGHRRTAWAFAFAVAGAGVAAVLVYRYIDIGAFGPFPDMYEPFWYAEKTASFVAEAVATATAAAGLALTWRQARRRAGEVTAGSRP